MVNMDKKTFETLVAPGDLIMVVEGSTGEFIDRFNKDTVHIGIYRSKSDTSFDLSSIIALNNVTQRIHIIHLLEMEIVDTYHTCMYGNVESVTLIQKAGELKATLTKLKNMGLKCEPWKTKWLFNEHETKVGETRARIKIARGDSTIITGDPKPTKERTVDELRKEGMVGIYEIIKKEV